MQGYLHTASKVQKKLGILVNLKHERKGPVDIAIDSIGIKVFNRGEWIRQKWAVRRGWIKLHITYDVANHVITGIKITNEPEADSRQFNELDAWENVGEIGKIYGDTAYDSRANFNEAARIGAEPVIKPMVNSTGRSKGSFIRAQTVREFPSDPELWKKGTGMARGGRLRLLSHR